MRLIMKTFTIPILAFFMARPLLCLHDPSGILPILLLNARRLARDISMLPRNKEHNNDSDIHDGAVPL